MTTTQCAHHWIIETADGPESKGRCHLCGEEREFANSMDYKYNWPLNRDPAPSQPQEEAENEE